MDGVVFGGLPKTNISSKSIPPVGDIAAGSVALSIYVTICSEEECVPFKWRNVFSPI